MADTEEAVQPEETKHAPNESTGSVEVDTEPLAEIDSGEPAQQVESMETVSTSALPALTELELEFETVPTEAPEEVPQPKQAPPPESSSFPQSEPTPELEPDLDGVSVEVPTSESALEPEESISITPEFTSVPELTGPASAKEVIKEVFVYKPTLEMMRALQKKSLAAIQQRKRRKIERIMKMFEKKQKITSADVQRVLIVSHNTAGRYLDVLEKEGRIRQVGMKGSSVHYVRI